MSVSGLGGGITNHCYRFFQERSNYDTLRNSFQRTAREWNHLPDTTVGASSIEEFRANLQQQVSHTNQCKYGPLFVVHFLMSVSGFRWWDHKPLLGIPVMVNTRMRDKHVNIT
jgi:hypothetical protein